MKQHIPTRNACRCALALLFGTTLAAHAQEDVVGSASDAFGQRIGQESIGLYSESLVRGFNLQQAGNYRIGDAYFARAASPPDTIVEGSRIRVGPSALQIDFPAPSGIVQYRLLPGDREHARVELGFQHLLDSNPRPYARAFFTERSDDGQWSLSGGAIGSPSARYIYGNQARYHGIGLVPRMRLGERWDAVAFYGNYRQRYQADVGFAPAGDGLPKPDRLRYLGQRWSRYDTRNTSYGAILSSRPRDDAWDFSLSGIHSRVDRPRSDFNIFEEVTAAGDAFGSTIVARDRDVFSRAFEGVVRRDWHGEHRRDTLTLAARTRRSDYRNPSISVFDVGAVSLFEPIPQLPVPEGDTGAASTGSGIDQHELGIGWQQQRANGLAANVGLRRVRLDESAITADGERTGRESAAWLYNASIVLPLSPDVTAFASTVRGIEEAGVAPQNASNRFEVLPAILARQAEVGMKWQPRAGLSLIGTVFEIEKPEPGFDADNVYRFLNTVSHRGIELSMAGEIVEGLNVVMGASWLRPRLQGETVASGETGERPVGRSARLALASVQYRPAAWGGFSLDADATYSGPRPADDRNLGETPGYTLVNIGARYRFTLGDGLPAALRLRVYNATDKYAWYSDSSGLQSWEPPRRVMLSLTLGE